MARRILVVNGHPDPRPERLCAGLAAAYAKGARAAGHEVRRIDVGALDFPLIRSAEAFEHEAPPPAIQAAQADLAWAEHLVIVHPLWLGGVPAVLKGFLEQVFRYGFAVSTEGMKGLLKDRSARMIVTMGMPALLFRLVFGAFGVRAVTRGVFWVSGLRPIRKTYLGGTPSPKWIARAEALGRRAA